MSDITTGEFGGCPECGRADGFLNDGPDHWFICDTHLTKWRIGSNLFSAWRDLSDEEAAEQRDRLMEYRQVDPFHPKPTEANITINLVETNVFTRWPCTVCGGCTEKVAILAEGTQPLSDDGEYRQIRVCEQCLEADDIDSRLEQHARQLEAEAGLLREMIGRLKVPTFAEWCKAGRDHAVRSVMAHREVSRDEAENEVPHDYPRAPDSPLFDGDGAGFEVPF